MESNHRVRPTQKGTCGKHGQRIPPPYDIHARDGSRNLNDDGKNNTIHRNKKSPKMDLTARGGIKPKTDPQFQENESYYILYISKREYSHIYCGDQTAFPPLSATENPNTQKYNTHTGGRLPRCPSLPLEQENVNSSTVRQSPFLRCPPAAAAGGTTAGPSVGAVGVHSLGGEGSARGLSCEGDHWGGGSGPEIGTRG